MQGFDAFAALIVLLVVLKSVPPPVFGTCFSLDIISFSSPSCQAYREGFFSLTSSPSPSDTGQ